MMINEVGIEKVEVCEVEQQSGHTPDALYVASRYQPCPCESNYAKGLLLNEEKQEILMFMRLISSFTGRMILLFMFDFT